MVEGPLEGGHGPLGPPVAPLSLCGAMLELNGLGGGVLLDLLPWEAGQVALLVSADPGGVLPGDPARFSCRHQLAAHVSPHQHWCASEGTKLVELQEEVLSAIALG